MSTDRSGAQGNQDRNENGTPHPIELGEVVKAYTDEVADSGEAAMNDRAASVLASIVERFRSGDADLISWSQITETNAFDWNEPEPDGSLVGRPAFAMATRSDSESAGGLILFVGEWEGVLYSMEVRESSRLGHVNIAVKRTVTEEGISPIDGPVTVHLPNLEFVELQLGSDGESDFDESPDIIGDLFPSLDRIDLGLSPDVTISLYKS